MKYTIEFKDIDLELPNYNLDIAEALEKADKVNMSESKSYREKTETLYNTISNILGKDKVIELVGKLKECDPNDIQILFLTIGHSYNKPVDDYQDKITEETMSKLEDMKEVAEQMNKVPDTVTRLKK
jgi:hypothetical protein